MELEAPIAAIDGVHAFASLADSVAGACDEPAAVEDASAQLIVLILLAP